MFWHRGYIRLSFMSFISLVVQELLQPKASAFFAAATIRPLPGMY